MEANNVSKIDYSSFSQRVIIFEVYKLLKKLYLVNDICNKFNVGDKNDEKIIKRKKCLRVTKEEIEKIESLSLNGPTYYHPKFIPLINVLLKLTINIYKDENNNLFITKDLCKKYKIDTKDTKLINGIEYCKIYEDDINEIENIALKKKVIIKRIYNELNEDAEKNIFIYYHDLDTNTYYVRRDTFEKAKNKEIIIEGTPRIIDDKNCYSISEKDIEKYEKESQSIGVERIINSKRYNYIHKTSSFEKRIIYKDVRENNIYIPIEYADNNNNTYDKKIIMNKECYKASIKDIEAMYNKQIYIVDVYTKPKEKERTKLNVIVCNNNGRLFISENILSSLNILPTTTKKIKINSTIYAEVNRETIEKIKNNENVQAEIIEKQVVPIN